MIMGTSRSEFTPPSRQPISRLPETAKNVGDNWIDSSIGPAPTSTVVPPLRVAARAVSTTATDLADYLVKKGLPFRDAHETVAHAVKAATTHACDLSELPLAVLQGFHPQIEKDVYECLSLRGSLNARNTLGGTAPAQVRAQIARHQARLAV